MEVPILKLPFDEEDAKALGEELSQALLSGRLAMGQNARRFEEVFAAFIGAKFAVGCQSGTAALEMLARALKLENKAVAVPALTFMATALAPIAAGARIIIVDVDPVSFQMDYEDLARKITPETGAVILVHLGGFIAPNWRKIKTLAAAKGLFFLEDAAHAHGAEIAGLKAGNLGLAGAFSFYPTKVLTTAEGGMVTTNSEPLYQALLTLRSHGQMDPGSNLHQSFGLNYRPSEIHALLGLRVMRKANWILSQRRAAAAIYDGLLKNSPLRPVLASPDEKPAYYKYLALLPNEVDRAKLKERLKEEFKVSLAGEVYATALTEQPFFRSHPETLVNPKGSAPVAEGIARRQICLPIWPGLTLEAQEYVVDSLLKSL
ncbi:MAG: DegT/DnrJ/EryC1/StrS family aminotransferase [Deltaproteobacteria bacterium]|jgi:dTDP-4-amino-4,6-dideoxygalactose transaminase|nr:DegT/DnrJ/EryC1/StrS family aminotransferase [Deltaproteobacteria bacterium]